MSKHKGLGPVCGRHRRHWALRTRRKPFHVACDNKCLSGNCETNYRRLLRDTYLWQSCLCLRAFQEPLCPYHASKTYRMKHPDTLSKNRLTSSVLIDCANTQPAVRDSSFLSATPFDTSLVCTHLRPACARTHTVTIRWQFGKCAKTLKIDRMKIRSDKLFWDN